MKIVKIFQGGQLEKGSYNALLVIVIMYFQDNYKEQRKCSYNFKVSERS